MGVFIGFTNNGNPCTPIGTSFSGYEYSHGIPPTNSFSLTFWPVITAPSKNAYLRIRLYNSSWVLVEDVNIPLGSVSRSYSPNGSSWQFIYVAVYELAEASCQDQRSYTDQYLITLNGWDKLGNAVTLTKTVTLNGGTDYMPLAFPGQNNTAWLGGIDRATVRALNGSSKNGQLALYARVFKVSVDVFGILTDPLGTFLIIFLLGGLIFLSAKLLVALLLGMDLG